MERDAVAYCACSRCSCLLSGVGSLVQITEDLATVPCEKPVRCCNYQAYKHSTGVWIYVTFAWNMWVVWRISTDNYSHIIYTVVYFHSACQLVHIATTLYAIQGADLRQKTSSATLPERPPLPPLFSLPFPPLPSSGNWTTRRQTNSPTTNSSTDQLADKSNILTFRLWEQGLIFRAAWRSEIRAWKYGNEIFDNVLSLLRQ